MPTAKFRRYEYRRRLPHYQKDNRSLFVTFRTQTGFRLSCDARDLALRHCLHDNGKTIRLHAVVVMPDHAHLLFTSLRDTEGWTFALPEILRAIKGSSARAASISSPAEPGPCGKTNPSTMFCEVMKACGRRWTTSARIP